MTPGSVLLYKEFRFEDGTVKPKLLVALSSCTPDGKVMCVLTTSQQHRRSLVDGCHPSGHETVFTFNSNLGGFKTTTWIVLKPRMMTEKGLLNRLASGECEGLFELHDVDLRAVINCLKKSEDVSPYHLSLLT